MTRRQFALDAFWTERPLVQRFIAETGRSSFSLRELIAFAEQLPDAIFLALQMMRGAPSQGAPHAAAPTRRPIQEARRRGNVTSLRVRKPAS
jgi:hypothetical protein